MPLAQRLVIAVAVCGLSLGDGALALRADGPALGRLLFVGIAYDEAPPVGHSGDHYNYAPDNLSRLFRTQTQDLFRSVIAAELKGSGLTHDRALETVRKLQRIARPEDVVFFYWGTHGGTNRKGWGASLPDGTVMHARELKQELGRVPCPVICMISTCGSGGFPEDVHDGVPLPDNVVALCACRGKQSTNNELDRAVCEALAGFADRDANRDVTLGEVVAYIPLRYRKIFRGAEPDEKQLPVLRHAPTAPLDLRLTRVTGDYAAVAKDGAWYGVTVLQRGPEGTRVRYLGYDHTTSDGGFSFPDEVVSDEFIDLPGGEPPVDVEEDGVWYPARILSREGSQFRIHYLGYPESDDATVPRSRVRFPFGDVDASGRQRTRTRKRSD